MSTYTSAREIIRKADRRRSAATITGKTLAKIEAAKGRIEAITVNGLAITIERTYDDHEIDLRPAILAALEAAIDLANQDADALEAQIQVVELR